MAREAESFLIARFRELYREVVRLKQAVGRGEWVFDRDDEEDREAGTEDPAPSTVWQALLTLLERQSLAARRSGGDLAVAVYRQAQFAMVALADEIFLHTDWAGREAWQSNLLESKLFGSHRAGELVFTRIDELLRDRDPVFLELATVYLNVLSLGFEGRHRGREEGPLELASYRRRLFQFVCNREPELYQGTGRLVPEAYTSTLDRGAARRLPYLRRWLYAAAGVVAAWLVAAHLVWRHLIADLEPLLERILVEGLR
jgi:type VI secretion system protein ImpK